MQHIIDTPDYENKLIAEHEKDLGSGLIPVETCYRPSARISKVFRRSKNPATDKTLWTAEISWIGEQIVYFSLWDKIQVLNDILFDVIVETDFYLNNKTIE